MHTLFAGSILLEMDTDLKVFLWFLIAAAFVMSIIYMVLPYLAVGAVIVVTIVIIYAIRNARKAAKPDPNIGHVKVNAQGIQRLEPGGSLTSIDWEEIATIKVLSQNAQISKEGPFLSLENASLGKAVLIPMSNPNVRYILPRIAKFHGFSKETLSKALSSRRQEEHPIWNRVVDH